MAVSRLAVVTVRSEPSNSFVVCYPRPLILSELVGEFRKGDGNGLSSEISVHREELPQTTGTVPWQNVNLSKPSMSQLIVT
jgi:hypothetical protein